MGWCCSAEHPGGTLNKSSFLPRQACRMLILLCFSYGKNNFVESISAALAVVARYPLLLIPLPLSLRPSPLLLTQKKASRGRRLAKHPRDTRGASSRNTGLISQSFDNTQNPVWPLQPLWRWRSISSPVGWCDSRMAIFTTCTCCGDSSHTGSSVPASPASASA